MNKKLFTQKLGFSLFELSISLVVIAILITGVVKGGQILQSSRIVSAQALTKSSPIPRISNLLVWYETTMEDSFDEADLDLGVISTWRNLSPTVRGNNATAGNAPTYISGVINGLPALRFNGTANFLNFNGRGLIGNNYTIFVVEQRRSTAQNMFISSTTGNASNNSLSIGYIADAALYFAQYDNAVATVAISGYTAPISRIYTARFSSSVGKEIYVNGVQNGTTRTDASGKTSLLDYSAATIGNHFGAAYYNGDIAEIIIFSKYLNSDEKREVEVYLGKKWKITVI